MAECAHNNYVTTDIEYCLGEQDVGCGCGDYQTYRICTDCGKVYVYAPNGVTNSMWCNECDNPEDWEPLINTWLPVETFPGLANSSEYQAAFYGIDNTNTDGGIIMAYGFSNDRGKVPVAPLNSPTFTGTPTVDNTTTTTAMLRNITLSTSEPKSSDGNNGDIWIIYGSSSNTAVYVKSATISAAQEDVFFDGLTRIPRSYICISTSNIPTGSTPIAAAVVYDGTNIIGQKITNTSNAQVSYDNYSFAHAIEDGGLYIWDTNNSTINFQAGTYMLIYTLSGTVSTIDQSVDSGATSITFTGLTKEPAYFSCIFKSNFGTSSNYQRVIAVATNDTGTIGGLAMSSQANFSTNWTYTYADGSLTITSNGTNSGGYFHQPGNYQLTYV